jgi:hypothetical protein
MMEQLEQARAEAKRHFENYTKVRDQSLNDSGS